MRHDGTPRRQTNAVPGSERADARGGGILFLDEQHLTRDCIGRELARRLPEFNIIERATARDLSKDDPVLLNVFLVILYVHADHMSFQGNDEGLDQHCISGQLSILENVAPDVPRILMSEVEVPEEILEAFRRRVRGYVPTTLPINQVAEAIRFVVAGGTFIPLSILSMHRRPEPISKEPTSIESRELTHFSPRQNEVLRMLWNGSSNKVIAYQLRMSESTVKVHIRHIMKKLNVNNRTQVVLRTRPQLVERDFSDHLGSPSGAAVKAIVAFEDNGSTSVKASARALDLSRMLSAPATSHRG
jgi:DNA-binding NarL/FixJ family response regulator